MRWRSRRRTCGIAVLLGLGAIACPCPGWAQDSSRVCLARTEQLVLPDNVFAPSWVYPEGKIDFVAVEALLDQAMTSLTGKSSVRAVWSEHFRPNDRVGIQLDVGALTVHQALLEAVIRRLVRAGVSPGNIIIYAGEESALFKAGFALHSDGDGVKVMGTDSEGYRGGLSRIVLDYCTAIINVARLRVDPQIGMSGALANCLAVVPHVERERLRRAPEDLAAAAARPTLRRKTRLHILDALRPGCEAGEPGRPPKTWVYGGLLVSCDPVALDAVGRDILVERLRESDQDARALDQPVTYLQPASERYRLGNHDLAKIEVVATGP